MMRFDVELDVLTTFGIVVGFAGLVLVVRKFLGRGKISKVLSQIASIGALPEATCN